MEIGGFAARLFGAHVDNSQPAHKQPKLNADYLRVPKSTYFSACHFAQHKSKVPPVFVDIFDLFKKNDLQQLGRLSYQLEQLQKDIQDPNLQITLRGARNVIDVLCVANPISVQDVAAFYEQACRRTAVLKGKTTEESVLAESKTWPKTGIFGQISKALGFTNRVALGALQDNFQRAGKTPETSFISNTQVSGFFKHEFAQGNKEPHCPLANILLTMTFDAMVSRVGVTQMAQSFSEATLTHMAKCSSTLKGVKALSDQNKIYTQADAKHFFKALLKTPLKNFTAEFVHTQIQQECAKNPLITTNFLLNLAWEQKTKWKCYLGKQDGKAWGTALDHILLKLHMHDQIVGGKNTGELLQLKIFMGYKLNELVDTKKYMCFKEDSTYESALEQILCAINKENWQDKEECTRTMSRMHTSIYLLKLNATEKKSLCTVFLDQLELNKHGKMEAIATKPDNEKSKVMQVINFLGGPFELILSLLKFGLPGVAAVEKAWNASKNIGKAILHATGLKLPSFPKIKFNWMQHKNWSAWAIRKEKDFKMHMSLYTQGAGSTKAQQSFEQQFIHTVYANLDNEVALKQALNSFIKKCKSRNIDPKIVLENIYGRNKNGKLNKYPVMAIIFCQMKKQGWEKDWGQIFRKIYEKDNMLRLKSLSGDEKKFFKKTMQCSSKLDYILALCRCEAFIDYAPRSKKYLEHYRKKMFVDKNNPLHKLKAQAYSTEDSWDILAGAAQGVSKLHGQFVKA